MSETIERFTVYKVVAGRAHWKGDPDGMWVLFEDAQRDLVALQAENEKLMEANLSVSVCASHTQEITDAGYMNGCVVCEVEAQVARADAAEARVTLLGDAIREWTEAVDELERRDGPRVMRGNVRERKAEATLRAFVGLIPPRSRKTSNPTHA